MTCGFRRNTSKKLTMNNFPMYFHPNLKVMDMIPTNFHLLIYSTMKHLEAIHLKNVHLQRSEDVIFSMTKQKHLKVIVTKKKTKKVISMDIDNEELNEGVSFYHAIDQMPHHEEIDNIDTDTVTDIEIQRVGVVYPLKVVKKDMTRHVNLLLTEEDGHRHYSTIINVNGLLHCQYNKHNGKLFYCYSCLHGFKAKKGEKDRSECVLLQEHQKYCKALKPQRVSNPEKDDILQYTSVHKQLKAPFVVYADFVSSLKPEGDDDVTTGLTTEKKERKSVSNS